MSQATADYTEVDEWLTHLETIHPSEIDMGLERITAVARQLDCVKPAPLVILVAGTNGKGTTCALLSQLLQAQGMKVGVYSSPHIRFYNERVSINGEWISDQDLCASFAAVEQARGDTSLTYFEFGTLAALWFFKQQSKQQHPGQQPLDAVVLEIGLGGRLDAVNIVEPDISIVTSIGLDHQSWLGDTLDDIAYEKCSIARQGQYLVCGQETPPEKAQQTVENVGGCWIGRGEHFDVSQGANGLSVRYLKPRVEVETETRTDLTAIDASTQELQISQYGIPYPNIATAIQALALLGKLPPQNIVQDVVAGLRVPGRMQAFQQGDKQLILDVAHNPQAAGYLATSLAQQGKKVDVIIVGILSDKDVTAVLHELPSAEQIWVSGLGCPRGLSSLELSQRLVDQGVKVSKQFDSVDKALDDICASGTYLLVGSFFTVEHALNWLSEQDTGWNSI